MSRVPVEELWLANRIDWGQLVKNSSSQSFVISWEFIKLNPVSFEPADKPEPTSALLVEVRIDSAGFWVCHFLFYFEAFSLWWHVLLDSSCS